VHCNGITTFVASKIIDTPLSSAGTLYKPNASCGIDNPLDDIVNDGSAIRCYFRIDISSVRVEIFCGPFCGIQVKIRPPFGN